MTSDRIANAMANLLLWPENTLRHSPKRLMRFAGTLLTLAWIAVALPVAFVMMTICVALMVWESSANA